MPNALDWSASWALMLRSTKRIVACNASYWDNQASSFDENNIGLADLTSKQMDVIKLKPEYSVLDIGAGTGRLTIPIAKRVQSVTALDPSKNMLDILHVKARKEKLTNIHLVHKRWEEWTVDWGTPTYDVVIASLSFFMPNLAKELKKMDEAAAGHVYLFVSASKPSENEIQRIIYKEAPPSLADHIYILNVLDGFDISPHVEVMDFQSNEKFDTMEDACWKLTKRYHIPKAKESELFEYLDENLKVTDGKFWLTCKKKVAMIWWTKT